MRFLRIRPQAWVAGICLLLLNGFLASPSLRGDDPGSVDFFETKIRPVLIKHCYSCHSSEAEETGGTLWLDSAPAMREGGDSGPAIEAGNSDASLLISALRYESTEMPPDAPLPAEIIDDFARWIDAGAPDPRSSQASGPTKSKVDLDAGRQFWSFRPLQDYRDSQTPEHTQLRGAAMIDHLIDQQLSRQDVPPNGEARPEVRLRRLAFDLTGLPPDPKLRERWLRDPSPEHWEQIVDELLDSRSFAQHWARHWMDVARYADSNGSDFNATFHDAWRYRDYLVDSFDQDRPFDVMVQQQIAGDLLPYETEEERYTNLVASTFLMLGPKMLSERDKPKLILDVVDEQIDTVGRAFLGLTLGCARCHDHKFDPVPTGDYYALAGIFRSTQTLNGESQQFVSTFNKVPLPVPEELAAEHERYNARLKELSDQVADATQALDELKREHLDGVVLDDSQATKKGKWVSSTYTKGFFGEGYVHDENTRKGECSIEFRTRLPKSGKYIVRIAYSHSGNRASRVPVTVESSDTRHELVVNQQKKPDLAPWKTVGTFEFSDQQEAVLRISNTDTDGYVIADAVQFLEVSEQASSESSTTEPDPSEESIAIDEVQQAQTKLAELQKQLTRFKSNAPEPFPLAMAPRDLPSSDITDSPIHIRGEVNNIGPKVPRGFLQVCGQGDASAGSPSGSGRLELAQWMTDPDHPLVSRVIVNRVWSHLLGEGIVRTVDNFGARGETPSHPELLDALAIDFMRDGWHFKALIRNIVLSRAYSRSSRYADEAVSVDPENRLLWRFNRKRMTAESIRDTMLVAAGLLQGDEPSGPVADKGVLVTKNNGDSKAAEAGLESPVRTLYLPVIRSNLPPLLTALDAADPDLLVGKRPNTNVPGQALVLMNSEDVVGWAHATAERLAQQHPTHRERLEASFRVCLSRDPTKSELELAEHYTQVTPEMNEAEKLERLKDWIAAVFASTEFRFLD